MEAFIRDYGYLAVFLGSTIEGEIILMTAGYFAYIGLLDLYYVMLFAFLGTLIADQGCFFVGYYYGPKILRKFPSLQQKSEKVFRLLHKYQNIFILSFRFIYGIRIASPLIIGASQLDRKRFALLNIPAAFIWAVTISWVGFFFGGTFDLLLEKLESCQKILFYIVVPVIILLFVSYRFLKKRRDRI
jgi:membrane protein DedA with SNARE-associated domain